MREREIEARIEARNALRRSAGLPLLGNEERERLRSVRARRIKEATFGVEHIRYQHWISEVDGVWAKAGRWSIARRQVAAELRSGMHVHHVLVQFGYCLIEDAWAKDGRSTYSSDEDANREFLKDLEAALSEYGWTEHPSMSRSFTSPLVGGLIKIEIGRPDRSGHFLNHLKSD